MAEPLAPEPDLDHERPPADPGVAERSVEQHVTLGGDPDEVWELLTDPEHLAEWLGQPVGLDLDGPGEGGMIDVDGIERQVRVVESDPGRTLRWDWWPVDDGDRVSTVEITLTPALPGTDVQIIEMAARPVRLRASAWPTARFLDLELALLVSRSMAASSRRR